MAVGCGLRPVPSARATVWDAGGAVCVPARRSRRWFVPLSGLVAGGFVELVDGSGRSVSVRRLGRWFGMRTGAVASGFIDGRDGDGEARWAVAAGVMLLFVAMTGAASPLRRRSATVCC